MWNKEKSVLLTQAIVRICYVTLAVALVALPIFLHYKSTNTINMIDGFIGFILIPFYFVAPAGYVALISIDKILINMKKEVVFDYKNVKLLRILSWCCFYATLVGVVSYLVVFAMTHNPVILFAYLILAAGELFVGLVVRVVKNIFESAIEIKDENDLTI
jgi:hypothetical protein